MAATTADGNAASRPLTGAAFDFLMLMARFCLGYQFMYFGSRKYLNPPSIAKMIASHGLPGDLVYLVIPFQFGLGVCMILGLFTRVAAVGFAFFCTFAPAIFWAYVPDNISRDFGSAAGFWFIFAAGAGRFSLDSQFRITCEKIFGQASAGMREWGILLAIARVMLSVEFIVDAIRKLSGAAYEKGTTFQDVFAAHGLSPDLIPPVAGIELILAFLLIVGFATRYVAFIGWCVAVMLAGWFFQRGVEGWSTTTDLLWGMSGFGGIPAWIGDFAKDFGTIGAFSALMAWGPGSLSWDAMRGQRGMRTATA
jgi:putative oxidoreductase